MSGITHPQTPTRQLLVRDRRRAKVIALAVVTISTALLVTLILVLDGGGSQTADTQQPAVQAQQRPSDPQVGAYPSATSVPPSLRPGTRYDGGPEESAVAAAISGSSR